MAIKLLKNKYLISFKTEQMNQLNLLFIFYSSMQFHELSFKVLIFWEGHKIMQNLHLTFVYSRYSQK